MYERLRQRPGNLFYSPFSVRVALAMARAGARGDTAEQMSNALSFPPSDDTLHASVGAILKRLAAAGGGAYEVAVANSIWGQEGVSLEPGFLEQITLHYDGTMKLVDFKRAADTARVAINGWVEEKTKQKIRELLAPGAVDAETRLVLANAAYFKGKWMLQFRRQATREEPFYLETGRTAQVPLMHQQERIRYVQADGYQAVDLEYRGGDLSMLVLLPDRKDGLPDLERTISARELFKCVARMEAREVKLFVPRFRISWGPADLTGHLAALGMRRAFARDEADFSGINGRLPPDEESLFISAVYHKAFVDVDEEGTEAAAATAVVMPYTASAVASMPPPVPVFRADHPFLFAIRDWKSGAILFFGRVDDPTRES
jgi:serpin B